MGVHTIRLPDVGEGIAECELAAWHVSIGDTVQEDDLLCDVMTDKAAIEVPSEVAGKIIWLAGEVGDSIAVGAKLVQLEVDGDGNTRGAGTTDIDQKPDPVAGVDSVPEAMAEVPTVQPKPATPPNKPAYKPERRKAGEKPMAAPSVRLRAREAGIDLRQVPGSGPAGRIVHDDLDRFIDDGSSARPSSGRREKTDITGVKIIGMRRKIAEKMALSKSRIPHITIVEEVDVSNLEDLRGKLNRKHEGQRPKLTILPFLMRAIVEAVSEQPDMNAHFDDVAGVVYQHGGVHIGIATQTPNGLTVPVVRHTEARNLWGSAGEVIRLAEVAREGKATREELTGSTITITSLGPLGAICTTPIINHPEVAIVGVNKIAVRPVWDGEQFQPRKMMNISCSFDHRIIDGWEAAVFVQKIKSLLETPAMLFIEE